MRYVFRDVEWWLEELKHPGLIFLIAVLGGCREKTPPMGVPPVASVADAVPESPPRIVCAPVQGPTRIDHDNVDGIVVASPDGTTALHLDNREIELRASNGATRRAKLPGESPVSPQSVFRGAGVIGFGAGRDHVGGGAGYVVWATLEPLTLVAEVASWTLELAGTHVYFNDAKCIIHALDLESGADAVGGAKACSWFHVWGNGIAVGKPKIANGNVVGVDFGGRIIDADTGKLLEKPYCPHPVGPSCVTFGDDLHEEVDDDPPAPASSSARTDTFEARGPSGAPVRGETSRPHCALSPAHATLWRDPAGRTLAFVASHVEGAEGPQLVVVDSTHVATTPLAGGEEIDQRRIDALRGFVPVDTLPSDDAALVRERERVLAAAANDRVRFMEYSAAASARTPCTAPPP